MALLWFAIYARFSTHSLHTPIIYAGGDEVWVHAVVKAVADEEIGLLGSKRVARLGAPFGANWNDFPLTEDLVFYVTGQLAKLCGVPAAINLAYLAAIILAACSFYLVSRYLRWRWTWCFAGAVLYGWSYYMSHRSVAHFNLLFYWPIPFWLLICWWTAARPGIPFWSRRFWFSAAVIFFTAWNNPYFTYLFLQLLALALAARLVRRYPIRSLASPLALMAFCAGLTLAAHLDTIVYQIRHGLNGGAALRYLSELELYSLRPVDLFLPFYHRVEALSSFSQSYAARTTLRGEIAGTYLGLIGCLALLHLWGGTLRAFLARQRQRLDGLSLQSLWVLLFCAAGSLSIVPGLFGFIMFRAMNRGSIVILTLALLHGVRVASRQTRRWPSLALVLVSAAVILLGLWDQTPALASGRSSAAAAALAGDRAFVRGLEKKLPKGAMIFQLPVVRSQEAAPVVRMNSYDQFRPYLASQTLRFSHGDDYGRATEEWRNMLATLPVPEMVAELERHGFHGVLLNRDAYPDRGAEFIKIFAEQGKPLDLANAHSSFGFIPLVPAANPQKPSLPVFCARGWHRQESYGSDTWRWTEGKSTIEVYRPTNGAAKTTVTFDLQSPTPRTVQVKRSGKIIKQIELTAAVDRRRVVTNIDWSKSGAMVEIDFSTDAPARFAPREHRAIAYRVLNLSEEPSPFGKPTPPSEAEAPEQTDTW